MLLMFCQLGIYNDYESELSRWSLMVNLWIPIIITFINYNLVSICTWTSILCCSADKFFFVAVIAVAFIVYVPSGTSSSIRPANKSMEFVTVKLFVCTVCSLYYMCMARLVNLLRDCADHREHQIYTSQNVCSAALWPRGTWSHQNSRGETHLRWLAAVVFTRQPHHGRRMFSLFTVWPHSCCLWNHLSQLHIFGLTKSRPPRVVVTQNTTGRGSALLYRTVTTATCCSHSKYNR